jgi:tyrosyl-tRNA synthetase
MKGNIEDLLIRGVANTIPGRQELEKVLSSGKKLKLYCGFDCTAPRLHLGHAVPFRKLQAFAEAGHEVIFLIADFTTLIGDTSQRDTERPVLTREEVEANFKTYKRQAAKILDFSKVKVRYNSKWLSKLNFLEIIRLCQHFSAGGFYSREFIQRRLKSGKRVGLHELLYSVAQGYDHYHFDADLQIGATDQTFNMQAGRTLQKDLRGKESFVMTLEILEGTDGRKMSKTWDNAIWLEDPPEEVFGKIMSLRDELISQYFLLATTVPLGEVNRIKKRLKSGENPMEIKKQLAWEVTKELQSVKAADKARENFEKVVQMGSVPEKIPELKVEKGACNLVEFLVEYDLSTSKSAARRLIEQGGLKINQQAVADWQKAVKFKDGDVVQVGKRRFVKIIVNK